MVEKDDYNILREKLKIDHLDKNTQKKLIEEFKKVGGKVDFSVFERRTKPFKRRSLDAIYGTTTKDPLVELKKRAAKRAEQKKHSSLYLKGDSGLKFKERKRKLKPKTKTKKEKKKLSTSKISSKTNKRSRKKEVSSDLHTVKKKTYETLNEISNKKNVKITHYDISERSNPSLADILLFIINGILLKVNKINYKKIDSDFILNFINQYINRVVKLGYLIKTITGSKVNFIKYRSEVGVINRNYVDFLFHIEKITDDSIITETNQYLIENLSTIIDNKEIREKFFYYFKKLFFVYLHRAEIEKTLHFVYKFYKEQMGSIIKKEELFDDFNYIIHIGFKKLHHLFCLNIGYVLSPKNPLMIEVLQFGPEERVGYFIELIEKREAEAKEKVEKMDKSKIEALEKKIEEREEKKIPNDVKKGFEILDKIIENYKRNLESYADKDEIIKGLERKDKMFMIYIFFKEFMEQYSVFFPSKSIEYKIDFIEHKKVDVKDGLNEALNRLTIIQNRFKNYIEIIKKEAQYDRSTWSELQKSLRNERLVLSRSLRGELIEIFREILRILVYVIKDIKEGERKIIANPEDPLKIDTTLLGKRKFNGVKIKNFFIYTYYFIRGVLWRLENTDLSGDSIYLDKPVI